MSHTKNLIHISDLHLFDRSLNAVKLLKTTPITSKRFLGWINHHLNRGDHFLSTTVDRMFNYLANSDWDILIVSGDVTTLALEREFEIAREYFDPLIKQNPVLFIPGNHDRYLPSVVNPDLMASYFKDCFPFNEGFNRHVINHLWMDESTVIIALDMALPRNHISSRGKVLTDISALKSFLSGIDESVIKIAFGHYPIVTPPKHVDGFLHGCAGKRELMAVFKEYPVDLYLHGHIHKTWRYQTDQFPKTTWINSGGCCRYAAGEWSGFHRISITGREITINPIKLNES